MKKSNFYLLYSGDKSLLSNEVNKLKKNLNITSDSIYYDIENVSDIIVEASTIGMFDPYKFIVIDSGSYFLQKSEFDISLLEEYFNNYNTNSYLIFILNSDSVDSKKKLYKLINYIFLLTVPAFLIFYIFLINKEKNKIKNKEKIEKNNLNEINLQLINLENEKKLIENNQKNNNEELNKIKNNFNLKNNLEKEKIKNKYLNKIQKNKIVYCPH